MSLEALLTRYLEKLFFFQTSSLSTIEEQMFLCFETLSYIVAQANPVLSSLLLPTFTPPPYLHILGLQVYTTRPDSTKNYLFIYLLSKISMKYLVTITAPAVYTEPREAKPWLRF